VVVVRRIWCAVDIGHSGIEIKPATLSAAVLNSRHEVFCVQLFSEVLPKRKSAPGA
jgi:hypothetical protein